MRGRKSAHEKGVKPVMRSSTFPRGSLVSITSYGPYSGCTGIIREVKVIKTEAQEPLLFYLVALSAGLANEPVWFEHDAVIEVVGNHLFPSSAQSEEGVSSE